jgi:hypothetical protein
MTYPVTNATDFIRRLGLSDVYSLTPGGIITCSVDKRGGLYEGAVLYTTDSLITKNSGWIAASPTDTNDVVDVAIPPSATGVAFSCSAITDPARPIAGALFTVKDANRNNSLSRHQRYRYASGDGEVPTFTPLLLPPPGYIHWIDFTDQHVLYSDTARTMLINGTQDEVVQGVVDKGSLKNDMTTGHGNATGPLFRLNMAGSGHTGVKFDRGDGTNGNGLRSVTAGNMSDESMGMFVGVFEETPGAVATLFQSSADPELMFRIRTTATQVFVQAYDSKGSQFWNHSLNTLYAGWVRNTGSAPEASVNRTAGTDTKTAGISPSTNDNYNLGTPVLSATSGFADGSVFELAMWDNAIAPMATPAQIEAYVTTKYALSWL